MSSRLPRSRLMALTSTALLLALVGCDSGNKAPATASPPTPDADAPKDGAEVATKEAKEAGEEKVKVVEGAPPGGDERYELQIDAPEAKAGESSTVVVRVVPKEPWHVNLDYPTSLYVDAPEGVELDKPQLEKSDASALDENKAQFDVAFTAAKPGEQTMTGKFKFAVCQDEACAPVTEDVELKVAVK